MLRVGELAKRSGLTVRALHHYDRIGLLRPSARSDAGYRLYHRDDIARLHQIQALRRFGVSLADIATVLANPGSQLAAIVDQQIAALSRQIEQANDLRGQLRQLKRQLAAGEEPGLAAWLKTLELMTMYDKYFTKEELARMPLFTQQAGGASEWPELVARMRALMEAGTLTSDPAAHTLARQWMIMLERDTGGNVDFGERLTRMHAEDAEVQAQTGVTPELARYVSEAFRESKLAIYQRYLSEPEIAFMREQHGRRLPEWGAVMSAARRAIDTGVRAQSPEGRGLAARWMELFRADVGDEPETHRRIAIAFQKEPSLLVGTWTSDDMLAFIREALTPPPA